ncbi:maleylpyruvate isomerase family mycothiol-dependent enzyme [Actinoplanes sichuanensis]|uniref:Maleylpyruvate isomerase family mycothiol-dependent enzyme n=1 Tax=Actinoplanes sichuanensis TaxID=512349 RepID=A0ABW4AT96_9ACTN|nr:maleylpyruvate isomerase family mycothiol-dependent enzyme [Actinoplanes sichuanensis]BEL07418.1 maleylpyruvate isomerase family mycothiol-dependent enzyme [Actinoplanes sichuanensis]
MTAPTPADVYRLTTANRLMIADLLDGLDDAAWRASTLCEGWTVQQMAAHFVQPMLIGFGRFFLVSFRYRGDTARTVDHFTRRLAQRPRTELTALLRRHAADRVDPPRVGPMGPFAETCVHLRDIARPLGLDADVPIGHWRILLGYLTAPGAAPALAPPGRLAGLRLEATDTDWSAGEGALVTGPAEALAMAITGRRAALPDLSGAGVAHLR